MRTALVTLTLIALPLAAQEPSPVSEGVHFDSAAAQRYADLALACVHSEYPNKIAHVLSSDKDVHPPRELTPSFYGCFDWHSAVHGHWLLTRLARHYPDATFAAPAREALRKSLTKTNIAKEVSYLEGAGRASFERPYGLAWLLQLGAELREWDDPVARELSANLAPLEAAAVTRLGSWLPKLSHPVRSGEHSQSAFALGLVHDYARTTKNDELQRLVRERILAYYAGDIDCPLAYEPSGEDFLSPCLAEADSVRRAMSPSEYAAWLGAFLPRLPRDGSAAWLRPGVVTDRSDGKLVHLDGLNLSRAWMLEGIASGLPENDPRRAALEAAAKVHGDSGIAAITQQSYEGGHWLGSFATYYVTRRGRQTKRTLAE